MSLKTDYKDDMYEGSRRWRVVPNEDGTNVITDATPYTQKGDKFGANDVNAITSEINKGRRTAIVNLKAGGWSANAPYAQRVPVAGMAAGDEPEVRLHAPKGLDPAAVRLRQKLTGMITDGETEDGFVTLYCGIKKPYADFEVLLKGVSEWAG